MAELNQIAITEDQVDEALAKLGEEYRPHVSKMFEVVERFPHIRRAEVDDIVFVTHEMYNHETQLADYSRKIKNKKETETKLDNLINDLNFPQKRALEKGKKYGMRFYKIKKDISYDVCLNFLHFIQKIDPKLFLGGPQALTAACDYLQDELPYMHVLSFADQESIKNEFKESYVLKSCFVRPGEYEYGTIYSSGTFHNHYTLVLYYEVES